MIAIDNALGSYRLILISVLAFGLGQANAAPQATESRHLQVGESLSFCVDSANMNNASGICLEAGAHYEFTVAEGASWCDAKIQTDANGWTVCDARRIVRPLIRAAEPNRRCPEANWFELIGTLDCGDCFRIGCRGAGWTYSPARTGQLLAFANDVPKRYGNNSGVILLTVTRVSLPAKPLPTCCK
jgi:hypothetical protein